MATGWLLFSIGTFGLGAIELIETTMNLLLK